MYVDQWEIGIGLLSYFALYLVPVWDPGEVLTSIHVNLP